MTPLFTAAEERALTRLTAARAAHRQARRDLLDARMAHWDAQDGQGDTTLTRAGVRAAVQRVRWGRTETEAAALAADAVGVGSLV